jgi:hypothetical protein
VDGSTTVIWSPESVAHCQFGGPHFQAAVGLIESSAPSLWASGIPVDGALHVSAMSTTSSPTLPFTYSWTLGRPLSDFVLPNGPKIYEVGVSILVSDPAVAAQLRTLRDRYISDVMANPQAGSSTLKVVDGAMAALLYMRDATPFEDATGLLPGSTSF